MIEIVKISEHAQKSQLFQNIIAIFDTNTLVSAFFWEGNEAELLRKIEQGKAKLYITNEIIKEIEDVIKRPKFN
ncbi:hypothetical protein HYX06_02310, partial [Candidatus Woesearchaeota archaeon]|nr:hypothetical protein [Candidatus Woesearchaeota archaeon]